MIVVLTELASLSMKEHVVNVPEPCEMYTAPPACSKIKIKISEKEIRRIVYILFNSICQHSMRSFI